MIEVLIYAFMALGVAAFSFRSYRLAVAAMALMGASLVAIFMLLASQFGAGELWAWAGWAAATKIVIVPLILLWAIKKSEERWECEPSFGFLISPVVAVAFAIGGALLIAPLISSLVVIKSEIAAVGALFIFILGIFTFILRRSFLKQILGYCLFENGAHLMLSISAAKAHHIVDLGILSDAVVAVIVMAVLAVRFKAAFNTLDGAAAVGLRG